MASTFIALLATLILVYIAALIWSWDAIFSEDGFDDRDEHNELE